jgi:predicted lipoprotein with Yx(FWY)xxD motif
MRRIHKLALPTAVAAAALFTAACGSSGAAGGPYGQPTPGTATPAYGQTSPSAAPAPGPAVATTVTAASSPLGQLMVNGSGRTLYLFDRDLNNVSTCYNACAQAWPPLLTSGSPEAGPNVSHADLATTTRRDGSNQVTFHGHPLYTFVADKTAGDTTGQGLSAFGDLWYVVGTNGAKITTS